MFKEIIEKKLSMKKQLSPSKMAEVIGDIINNTKDFDLLSTNMLKGEVSFAFNGTKYTMEVKMGKKLI